MYFFSIANFYPSTCTLFTICLKDFFFQKVHRQNIENYSFFFFLMYKVSEKTNIAAKENTAGLCCLP